MKILVIEDEKSLREAISEMLAYEGYDVIQARDGVMGVEKASEDHPDLIICDIAMPGLDGYQVLSKIRQEPQTTLIPFIFLTARVERPSMRQGMELGADDYLTKPFTNAELVSAVNTRLSRVKVVSEVTHQEVEQAKKQLTNMVAHELRTPLVSIMMVQDLISRQFDHLDKAEMDELFSIMRSGSDRLSHLVEQMVLKTQIETGIMSEAVLDKSGMDFPMWEILVASINTARRFSYHRGSSNVVLDERNRHVLVRCHKQALIHALAELIANALDYSPEECDVIVSEWTEGDDVWMMIQDYGVGMANDGVHWAMRYFQQIDRDVTEQQGMGMGLPLARQIIEAHKGTFQINSIPCVGTSVTIKLPAVGWSD